MVEVFDSLCPVYMAYGMSYHDFWNCDPKMYIAYREAHKLDIKRRNEEMWLQGLYNFEAFSKAISNIHLDNKSHKINKYRDKPFEMFEKTEAEKRAEKVNAKQKVIDYFNRLKSAWDNKRKNNGG